MSYLEELNKLRQRVVDAVDSGIILENNSGVFTKLVVDVLDDAENNAKKLSAKAEEFRRQAILFDGQAQAFRSVGNMLFAVVNGMVLAKEKADREEQERAIREAEESAEESESEKQTRLDFEQKQTNQHKILF